MTARIPTRKFALAWHPHRRRCGLDGRRPGDQRCRAARACRRPPGGPQAGARLLETEDRTDDYESLEAAGRAADAALDAIMKTPPTSVAGARAVIEHLVEWDKGSGDYDYLPTLLRSPLLA
jgi:hypothetical protein